MYSDLCYVGYWSFGLDGHLVNICHTGPSKAKFKMDCLSSLRTDNPSPTTAQIEEILDGNLCRCTGYRPIFDAFRSFSSDNRSSDIEDLVKKGTKKCPK